MKKIKIICCWRNSIIAIANYCGGGRKISMAKSAQNTSAVAFVYHRLTLIARHPLYFRMIIESIDYYLTCLGSLMIFWRTLKCYTPLHKKNVVGTMKIAMFILNISFTVRILYLSTICVGDIRIMII